MDRMIQQVNFYRPAFKKQIQLFSAHAILGVVGVLVFVLLALTLVTMKQISDHEQLVQQKTQQKDQLNKQLEQAREKLKPREKNQLLVQQLREKRLAFSDIKKIKIMLDNVLAQSDSRFSGYFDGLARSRVNGLWLTQIKVGNSGQAMTLSGQAASGDLVPGLLLKLENQPAFINASFHTVQIQEDPKNNLLTFRLETLPKTLSETLSGQQ